MVENQRAVEDLQGAACIVGLRNFLRRVDPALEIGIVIGSLIILQWIWMPLAIMSDNLGFIITGYILGGIMLTWMGLGSHWARGHSLDSLGLTSPKKFITALKQLWKNREIWNAFLLVAGITLAWYLFNRYFLEFTILFPVIGEFNEYFVSQITNAAIISIVINAEFVMFVILTLLFKVKSRNIKHSIQAIAKYALPFIIVLLAWSFIQFPERFFSLSFSDAIAHFSGYIYFAFFQQVGLLVYVHPLLVEKLERNSSLSEKTKRILIILITSALFAYMHFPAWILSTIAFVFELIITWNYHDPNTRNVFVICLFHAACGVIIVFLLNIDLVTGFAALI